MLASLAAAALLTASIVAEEPQAAPAPTEAKAAEAKPAADAKPAEPVKAAEPAKPAVTEAKWEVKAETKGVVVYSRPKAGSEIKELKTVGEIDSPPPAVFRVLTDFEAYKDTMPYTEESVVISTEEVNGKKAWHFYSLINAPLASRRDYAIKVEDQSDWQDGKGYMKTYWDISPQSPKVRDGAVRVKINQGSWTLEPVDGGKKTKATYYLFTDPGGSLPTWIANKANSSAIPDIFVQLRKLAKDPKYAGEKK